MCSPVAEIVAGLRRLGLRPVLVGGMALVVLGSRRVTRDFDFLVKDPGDRRNDLLGLIYDRGIELASRVNENGDVVATIDNLKVCRHADEENDGRRPQFISVLPRQSRGLGRTCGRLKTQRVDDAVEVGGICGRGVVVLD